MSLKDKLSYKLDFNLDDEIQYAFRLGLLWNRLPEWIREDLDRSSSWTGYHFYIDIIAETKDSWHEGYRSLREAGWVRTEAERKGGLITYMLEYRYEDSFGLLNDQVPEDFRVTKLQYRVTLPTCRQVKTGTKEVDVFETVCDDIVEPEEEDTDNNNDPIAAAIENAAENLLNDVDPNLIGGA
jgi:hypothetical protein